MAENEHVVKEAAQLQTLYEQHLRDMQEEQARAAEREDYFANYQQD